LKTTIVQYLRDVSFHTYSFFPLSLCDRRWQIALSILNQDKNITCSPNQSIPSNTANSHFGFLCAFIIAFHILEWKIYTIPVHFVIVSFSPSCNVSKDFGIPILSSKLLVIPCSLASFVNLISMS
jgi:hypothetical protein